MKQLLNLLRQNAALTVKTEEPMCRHTSFQIGGPVDMMIEAKTADAAIFALRTLREQEVPYLILGKGSNLLVSDAGIRGAVLKLNDAACVREGCQITAGAGVLLSKLAIFAQSEGLSGLAFAHGIPGTLGGACMMNAGAYGGEMKDVVCETEYLDVSFTRQILRGEEHGFGYRTSAFRGIKNCLILSVKMRLTPGDPAEIRAEMDDYAGRRREKQPLEYPSAGSVFKRPEGHFAGALIEQCGLKGLQIGGAQVSEKHAGFIINRGGATCDDVLRLIETIQKTVLRETGVMLECEICRV